MSKQRTRGERVIAFIERYCPVPEGKLIGRMMRLDPFQKDFILATYDNKDITLKAILSLARKNGKTGLIAGILMAHICGPEARLNSQIVSGAMSRDQAAIVFKLAQKMIQLSPELTARTRIIPSIKTIMGLGKNVEFRALAAEGKTAHGLSPVLAILDEVGQVRGPQSDFVDAIVTAQGAHDNPLIIVISTQAPNDSDLLSIWIDDALTGQDPQTIVRLHAAPEGCDLDDEKAWAAANPAIETFRSKADVATQAGNAMRMPASEPTFRNLILNQRVEMVAPLVARSVWVENGADADEEAFIHGEVYGALDLSGRTDLTAAVFLARWDDKLHLKAYFWTPLEGLKERSRTDRTPYDIWVAEGLMMAVPGRSIDYEVVAKFLGEETAGWNLKCTGFDPWRIDIFKKEADQYAPDLKLEPFGQGFKDMAPAVDALEEKLLAGAICHGGNPVLTSCIQRARVEMDPAGNRKLTKSKSTGRIDGAVAMTMAVGLEARFEAGEEDGDLDGMLTAPLRRKG